MRDFDLLPNASGPPLLRAALEMFPGVELVPGRFELGYVRYDWLLPRGLVTPIGWNHRGLERRKWFITQSPIELTYDAPGRPEHVRPLSLLIPGLFEFDGPSTPRETWWIDGFAPMQAMVWNSLPHDYVCDNPWVMPRAVADAIFGHLGEELAKLEFVERRRALEAFWAVRIYTRLKQWVTDK